MTEKVIHKKNWEYTLVERDGRFILKVLCGGVAMYEVEHELSKDDAHSAMNSPNFCQSLATKIRERPSNYQ